MLKTLKLFGLLLLLLAIALMVFSQTERGRIIFNVILKTSGPISGTEVINTNLIAAPGFKVTLFADNITHARSMRITSNGDVIVSSPKKNSLFLVSDTNGDGSADQVTPLLENLKATHGFELHDDWLYITEMDKIGRIPFDQKSATIIGEYQPLITGLTTGNHYTRTLRYHQGWFYLTMGSSCNVCEEDDKRLAAMSRFKPDGSQFETYATGMRNSVGFDWAPWNNALYATDNGRDLLGDNYPPCELNQIIEEGFYGWPHLNGNNKPDPDYGVDLTAEQQALVERAITPEFDFPAHNAPLGMQFNRNGNLPHKYHQSALVALHGSWNRSTPDGYKVVSLHWDNSGKISSQDFLTGFLKQDGSVVGRPVEIAQMPNGDFLISDDYAGAIYRVAYKAEK